MASFELAAGWLMNVPSSARLDMQILLHRSGDVYIDYEVLLLSFYDIHAIQNFNDLPDTTVTIFIFEEQTVASTVL